MEAFRKLLVAVVLAAVPLMYAGQAMAATEARKTVPYLPATQPGSLVVLLGVESVRNELRLNSLQRAVLDSMREELRTSGHRVVQATGPTPADTAKADSELARLVRQYNQRATKVLNARQLARLKEIEHQILGGYMLLSPEIQSELQLTAKQKSKLASIYAKAQNHLKAVNGWYRDGEISHYERLLYLHDDRLSRSESMLKVLTPAQRKEFETRAGDRFPG